MAGRRSIEIDEFRHGDLPFPVASRVANVLYTSAISGYDSLASRYADGLEAQARLMFDHVRRILAAGGARPEDVVRMTFYVKTPAARPVINAEWMRLFPDPASRPARHTLNYETPGESLMQCDAVAVIDEEQSR
jgi:2-iminobutanoate/2-iminopropanoate deaminase